MSGLQNKLALSGVPNAKHLIGTRNEEYPMNPNNIQGSLWTPYLGLGEIRTGKQLGRRKGNGSGRYIWHACVDCGKKRWVLLRQNQPDSPRCRKCAIRNRPAPERKEDKNGYVLVRLTPETEFFRPMVKAHSNYIYEHRLIMAQQLRRCLLPWEVVHHKRPPKGDNKPENLRLLPNQSWHIIDTQVRRYIRKLEVIIERQQTRTKLLEWRVKELEQGGIQNDRRTESNSSV